MATFAAFISNWGEIVMKTFSEERYNEVLGWLFEQFPSYQVVGDRAYKPGVDTMRLLDSELGHPHRRFTTIHVAGTNGKGSVSSMMAAALASCGLKVGLYTSPHLRDFRERMKVVQQPVGGGEPEARMIEKQEVLEFLDRMQPVFESAAPSFFEITTAMAFDWFASEEVDVAVIEVGLGGRLDSTNVITPVLSVITNISLEHCQYLGHTLAEVAGEKAGIIKPDVPVVIGETLPETRPVFEARASECGSDITFAEEASQTFINVSLTDMDLQGDYQQRNLRTLDAAISALCGTAWGREHLGVIPASELKAQLREGICGAARITGLRARWETIREAGGGMARIICDTGHNAHAFRWIREQIDKVCCDYDNIFFVLGAVADKDVHAIAEYLPHDVNYIITTPSTHRAIDAADLANVLSDYSIPSRVEHSPQEAMAMAESLSSEKDLIFVAGSNYLVSDILGMY